MYFVAPHADKNEQGTLVYTLRALIYAILVYMYLRAQLLWIGSDGLTDRIFGASWVRE